MSEQSVAEYRDEVVRVACNQNRRHTEHELKIVRLGDDSAYAFRLDCQTCGRQTFIPNWMILIATLRLHTEEMICIA